MRHSPNNACCLFLAQGKEVTSAATPVRIYGFSMIPEPIEGNFISRRKYFRNNHSAKSPAAVAQMYASGQRP
jgi:hypothetical protein